MTPNQTQNLDQTQNSIMYPRLHAHLSALTETYGLGPTSTWLPNFQAWSKDTKTKRQSRLSIPTQDNSQARHWTKSRPLTQIQIENWIDDRSEEILEKYFPYIMKQNHFL